MPDEYGRPNGSDFMLIAKGLREYNEGSRREAEERGLGLGLGVLEADPNAPRPDGVSNAAWAKAQEQQGKAKSGRLLADQAGQALEESKLSNEYMGLASAAKTPEERLAVLGKINPGTLAGAKALASVQKQVLGTQENQVALLGSVLKKGAVEYDNVVRPALVAAKDMADKGDEEGAAQTLAQLSRTIPLRGEFRWNKETRTLDHYHNERNAGLQPQAEGSAAPGDGYAQTGRSMSVKEALDLVGSTTKEDYAMQMASHRVANMEFNAKALESGGHVAQGLKGEKLRVVPLINLGDSTRQFAVFDEAGRHAATLGNDEFMKSGIMVENKEQRAYDLEQAKLGMEGRKLALAEKGLNLRADGSGSKGKSLLETALDDRTKAVAQAQKSDPFMEPEEAERQADASVFKKYSVLTGREVKSYEDLRGVMPKAVRTPRAAPAASQGDVSVDSAPPAAAFKGLEPGKTRSFRNSDTGEVQTWTVDPVSKQPVRVKAAARKGG